MQDLWQSHSFPRFSFDGFARFSAQALIHLRGKDFSVVYQPSFGHGVQHYPLSSQAHHPSFPPHSRGCIACPQADVEVCDLLGPDIWKLYGCPAMLVSYLWGTPQGSWVYLPGIPSCAKANTPSGGSQCRAPTAQLALICSDPDKHASVQCAVKVLRVRFMSPNFSVQKVGSAAFSVVPLPDGNNLTYFGPLS